MSTSFEHRQGLIVRTIELADAVDQLKQALVNEEGIGPATLDLLDRISDELEDVIAYRLAQLPGYYAWRAQR